MIKFTMLTVFGLSILSTHVNALEILNEADLAQTTGQDGVTASFNLGSRGAITFDHIVIDDSNGIAGHATHTNRAGLGYITQNANTGVTFYNNTTPVVSPFAVHIDADRNNNNPVMNVGIVFANNVNRIKLDAFSIGLVQINPTTLALNTVTRRDLFKTGANGININLKSGNPLGINLQLGNQPQGALFKLSGSLESITMAEPIEILSYSGCTASVACTSNSSLKFSFELNANAASTQGIRLNNIYANVTDSGLELGGAGTLDAFDVKLRNVTMGQVGSTGGSSVFNGLPNNSVGNFGLEGVKVTDLKVNVRGL